MAKREVILVCGPPGAGKTTYAAGTGLKVYDRDDPYWRNEHHFAAAIKHLHGDPNARAVVIRAGATRQSRNRTATLIGATKTVMLAVDADTCIRRIRERGRQPIDKQIAGVRQWWRTHDADNDVDQLARRRAKSAKYNDPAYIKARAYYADRMNAGVTYDCAEPICLMPSRSIDAAKPWDLSHNPSGTRILGPSHPQCNRTEGAIRRHTPTTPRRDVL